MMRMAKLRNNDIVMILDLFRATIIPEPLAAVAGVVGLVARGFFGCGCGLVPGQMMRMAKLRDLLGLRRTADAGEGLLTLFGFGRGLSDSAFAPYVLGIAVFARIVGHSAALCGAFVPMMRFIMRPFRRPAVLV